MFRTHPLSRIAFVALITPVFISSSAWSAGFEKAQTWSAKAASLGGAVVGSSSGSEALYFNPAGLVESSNRGEVSFNISPTFSKFTGVNPYSAKGSIAGTSGFSPLFGLVAAYQATPKLGIGVGYYVSGGTKSKFEGLDYSNYNANFDSLKPTVETDLAITEAAVGAGYQLAPGFRVGLAWRIIMVNAKFSTVASNKSTYVIESNIENIKATQFNGFKLGAQYEEPNHRWGLGANFRSAVSFNATGDASRRTETAAPGDFTTTNQGKSELQNAFPYQIAIGGWTRATELLRISYEYSFTNYTQNKGLVITTGATTSTIVQNWKNQHIARLGGEYTGLSLPLRLGYAYTSQVTPSDHARSTFASPGPAHAFSVGSGMILTSHIDLDGALEYTFASGKGSNIASGEVLSDSDFKSYAYAAHLSAKYRF
jgi:hypothetical protein